MGKRSVSGTPAVATFVSPFCVSWGFLPPTPLYCVPQPRSCPGSSLCPLVPLAQNDCSVQTEARSLAPCGHPVDLVPWASLAPVTRSAWARSGALGLGGEKGRTGGRAWTTPELRDNLPCLMITGLRLAPSGGRQFKSRERTNGISH